MWLALVVGILILIDGLLAIALGQLELDISQTIRLYGVILILHSLIQAVTNHFRGRLSHAIALDYEKKAWTKYTMIGQDSREKDTVESFRAILEKGTNATVKKYTWSIESATLVGSCAINLVYVFVTGGHFDILLTMIAINVAWYYMVTSSALKELNDKRKSDRITWKERIGKISLWATRLHNSDTIDVAPLIQLNEQIMLNDEDTTMKRVKSTKLQQLPNQMIYLIISFVVEDISLFPKLFIVFNNFNRALASTSSFFNEWQTMQDDLQKVDDFWAEKTFCEKPEQRQLSKTVEKITIKHGDHIRIIGPTGSGKTTFVKGIFGWLSGLSMDGMSDLLAFNDDIAMMRQNIREITPFEKTTIRQLFYDEKDDAKINDRLAETNADTWVRTIMKGDLDKLIGNKISGGQKTQICLAITLYKMHKNRSNWLILDEPEQGVDTEQVPDILRKIFEKYSEKTILIITHMCDCQIRQLGILKTINVENKTITSNF